MSNKALKTPLRYPGGKSRACTKMEQFFPDFSRYREFREPFLGGGSVALHVSKMYPELSIWVNDLYEPLVNFWQTIQDDGENLQYMIWSLKNKYPDRDTARELFLEAKEKINNEKLSSRDRAAYFYIVNKCSFSGLTESSSFSKQASISNFSMRGIEKLPQYADIVSHWHINQYSYRQVANWLTSNTGRYISHVGLRKRLAHERQRKNTAKSLRKWAEYAETAIAKAKEIEEARTGARTTAAN